MTTTTGRAVLALDEILCKLTPEQAAAFRAMTPTWLLDQTDATVDEIHRNLKAAKDAGIVENTAQLANGEHPGWVRLGIIDTLVAWWSGRHSSCTHAPHPLRPQPVVAVAWKPGLVVCGHCTHLLSIPTNSTADRTCDGCGRVTAGPDADDPMYPTMVAAGVLTYGLGLCRDCRYWEYS